MIPDRDYYADKNGKLTDDPTQWAFQVAVRGCFLDPRAAKRYGITDTLVSVDEPNALRRVTGQNAASVQIKRIDDAEVKQEEPEAETPTTGPSAEETETEKPSSEVAAEPTTEKSKTPAKKAADHKGQKK